MTPEDQGMGPMTLEKPRAYCPECKRDDISLTANGRLRSHITEAGGPKCPNGSGEPGVKPVPVPMRLPDEGRSEFHQRIQEFAAEYPEHDPRPTQHEVQAARQVGAMDPPEDVEANAYRVLYLAEEYGVRYVPPPGFDPDCPTCDTCTHTCPGCGDTVPHGTGTCDSCVTDYGLDSRPEPDPIPVDPSPLLGLLADAAGDVGTVLEPGPLARMYAEERERAKRLADGVAKLSPEIRARIAAGMEETSNRVLGLVPVEPDAHRREADAAMAAVRADDLRRDQEYAETVQAAYVEAAPSCDVCHHPLLKHRDGLDCRKWPSGCRPCGERFMTVLQNPGRPGLPHDRGSEETVWTPSEVRGQTPMTSSWATTPTTDRDPGSRRPTPVFADGADPASTRETPSVPTVTGTGSAAVTDTADDILMQAPQPERKPKPDRDRYGRYKLPHPATGRGQAWTRATTFAKSISDTYALSQWSQRMTLKGAALRPDLVSLAHSLDVKADKDQLNDLVEQAKDAAGQKVSANLGTALHAFTGAIDSGQQTAAVPPQHIPDITAYTSALRAEGIRIVPELIERITCVPQFGVAGTFDRVMWLPDGSFCIGDLKTGRGLQYGWQEIAIQLALYAYGINQAGVYDLEAKRWLPPSSCGDSIESGPWQVPQVRTDFGIVMHLPVGEAKCTLYRVDLAEGWAAATLCASVRTWRQHRNLSSPLVVSELPALDRTPVPVVREPTWEEKFGLASSQGELASLFDAAKTAGINGTRIQDLTRIGMARLAVLREKAG